MLDETARGVFTIAVTPFLPDGALDLDGIDRMVAFYEAKGATGLTVLGMMGEADTLSPEEALALVRRTTARTALPVIAGVSSPDPQALATLADGAMQAGAAGVMVAPPRGMAGAERIRAYFSETASRLGPIPFVLQDFPLATGVRMPPGLILDILADCPGCVMLKHEDWPGLDKISALRAASDAGARRISILTGNGGLFLVEEMLRGADGAMTGFAWPEMMAQVIAAVAAGGTDRARDIFDAYLPMVRYEAQPEFGLAIRKHSLARRGAIPHATTRRAVPPLSAATGAEVAALAARQERRLAALGL